MNVLGLYIGSLSGIWTWIAAFALYLVVGFVLWCVCAMSGKADERIGGSK